LAAAMVQLHYVDAVYFMAAWYYLLNYIPNCYKVTLLEFFICHVAHV